MVTGTADTVYPFLIVKGKGGLPHPPPLRFFSVARLARLFDRAHPGAPGASVLSEITFLTGYENNI